MRILRRRKKGATAIEYGLLAALIAIPVAVYATTVGKNDSAIMCTVSKSLGGSGCGPSVPNGVYGVDPFASPFGFGVVPTGTVCTSSPMPPSGSGSVGMTRVCVESDGKPYSASTLLWTAADPSQVRILVTPGYAISTISTNPPSFTLKAPYFPSSCLPATSPSAFTSPPGAVRISPTVGVYNEANGYITGASSLPSSDSITLCP